MVLSIIYIYIYFQLCPFQTLNFNNKFNNNNNEMMHINFGGDMNKIYFSQLCPFQTLNFNNKFNNNNNEMMHINFGGDMNKIYFSQLCPLLDVHTHCLGLFIVR